MSELLDYIIKRAEKEGATQAEAFFARTRDLRVLVKKNEVKICEEKDNTGIGIRVAFKRNNGFSLGFSYTTELNREAAERTIKQALKVASARKPDPNFKSFQEAKPHASVNEIYDKKLVEIEPDEIIKLALNQIELAQKDKRIEVFDAYLLPQLLEIEIANSLGVQGSYKKTNFYCATQSVAKEGDSRATGFDEYSNCYYNESEALKLAENASSLAISQLHAKPVEKGKMDLIIKPYGLAQLFAYTLGREVGADLVQTQRSPFVNKLGQQVAAEIFTIHDDGLVPKACGSKVFDDEGCPAQRTTIVEKGVLKNFLHNTYTANKEGRASTGNSLRYMLLRTTPKHVLEPSVGPSNLIVEPGTATPESLISEVKNGVITTDFLGCHTASEESGDFSVSLHCAFKIENGEIKYPVKEAMLGGNLLELLKKISVIANDVKQVQFHLNVAFIRDVTLISPSLLVKDVTIAG